MKTMNQTEYEQYREQLMNKSGDDAEAFINDLIKVYAPTVLLYKLFDLADKRTNQ